MDELKILQSIPPEVKLEQAMALSDFVRELSIKNITEQADNRLPPEKIQQELKKRLLANQK